MRTKVLAGAATTFPWLSRETPGQEPERIELTEFPFTLGRNESCDFQILSSRVSREHAEIIRDGTHFGLRDLKSTNGTLLNSKAVDRRQLQDADVIAIGRARLVFRDQSAAPPQAQSFSDMGAMDPDKTMVLTGKAHRGPATASPAPIATGSAPPPPPGWRRPRTPPRRSCIARPSRGGWSCSAASTWRRAGRRRWCACASS